MDQLKKKTKKPSQNKRRTERRRKAYEEQLRNPETYIPLPVARRPKKKKKAKSIQSDVAQVPVRITTTGKVSPEVSTIQEPIPLSTPLERVPTSTKPEDFPLPVKMVITEEEPVLCSADKESTFLLPPTIGLNSEMCNNAIIDGVLPTNQISATEQVVFTLEEAIRLLSPDIEEPESTAVPVEEKDMDVLDIQTSPVHLSPPRLAFFQVGSSDHPLVKSSPTCSRDPESPETAAGWRISPEIKKDLRITFFRSTPPKRVPSAKQRILREWENSQAARDIVDPGAQKRPKPPPKRSSAKNKHSKSVPLPLSPRQLQENLKSKERNKPKRVKRSRKNSPPTKQQQPRPSTYKTPKRYRPATLENKEIVKNVRRNLF